MALEAQKVNFSQFSRRQHYGLKKEAATL